MHMLIRGLVYAENEYDALSAAKYEVFEPLVRDRTFDYYRTFDEDGDGAISRNRWGPLPVAAPVDTAAGEQLIEEGWQATVRRYEYHLGRLEEFFRDHELSQLWEDFATHNEYHYNFSAIGEFEGSSTFLYEQPGRGIRDRSQLENHYPLDDQNRAENRDEEELFVVPADVPH